MSQERVARLESLLSRVQENRQRPRPTAAKPEVARSVAAAEPAKAAPAPEAAKPVAVEPPRSFGRPPAQQPAAAAPRSVAPPPSPAKPVAPAAARPPIGQPAQPVAARAPEAPPARRPGQDRTATPLEMAVAELDLAAATKPEVPRREPTAAGQLAPTKPMSIIPDMPLEDTAEPYVIEPEPIREPARPIAQVVSRHSPQVDATFGAMLKRSLSLRPH